MRKTGYMAIILGLALLPGVCLAQEFPFQQEMAGIPVTINGWQPFAPWMPGLSYTRPAFGDFDIDGDFDLVIGDYAYQLYSYRNAGTSLQAQYQFMPSQLNLWNTSFWVMPSCCDLNNDGDTDILIGILLRGFQYLHALYFHTASEGNFLKDVLNIHCRKGCGSSG